MKRLLTAFIIFTVLVLCTGALAGCSTGGGSSSEPTPPPAPPASSPDNASEPATVPEPEEALQPEDAPEVIRVFGLKGPTTMGLVKLWQDSDAGLSQNQYSFELGTTDEVIPKLVQGEIDIAAIPANLASVLYANTDGQIQVLALNTLGVLYVVEKDGETINSVEDLRGKTVLSTGKGAIPEYAFNYVLAQHGMSPETDLTVEFKSEPAEIIPLLAQGQADVALIQQPFATTALDKVEGLRVALDWTQEWNKVAKDGSALITGVTVVRREFAEQYPHALEVFLKEYADSVAFTATDTAAAAQLVGERGIVAADIAEKAMPACNLVCITGEEMRQKLQGYLQTLYDQNPQSVGGAAPDEGFYYIP